MARYIVNRLLLMVPVLLGVTLLVFLIFHLTPGDPARVLIGQMGQGASPEAVATLRHQLGLDRPWYIQYINFLRKAVVGDFGRSFRGDRPVLPDLPSIQGSVLWVAVVFSLVNLVVDLGYAALDPRIRYD